MKKQTLTLDKRLDKIELILEELKKSVIKLDKEIDITQKIVRVEIATNAIHVEQELKKKITEFHREDLDKMDHIVGELQTMRDENTIGTYQIRELREEVEALVKRINILEKSQSTS